MAILLFDDFVGYTPANVSYAWQSRTGNVDWTYVASGGRNNGPYISIPAASAFYHIRSRSFTPTSTLVCGFALYVAACTSSLGILQFVDGSTVHITIQINADFTLSITRNGTALTGGTSVSNLAANTWYYIEAKVSIGDSIGANSCQINVNGTQWVNVTTGQDTRNGGNATVNNIIVGRMTSSSGLTCRLADLYLSDGTTFLGDCRVETLYVDSDGPTQDFTASSGAHYLTVDETTSDDDSTYVQSATAGHKELFGFANLATTPTTVHGVAVWNLMRKTDASSKTARTVIRSGGTDYDQTIVSVIDSYQYDIALAETDPATAAAWTPTNVNAIQAGLKVVT